MIDAGTHGAANWVDLTTPDVDGSQAFYTQLFGWDVAGVTTSMGEYFTAEIGGKEIAGLMEPGAEQPGSPAAWTTFFYVADIDDTVGKVKDAGGQILEPPFDIPGDAKVAVIADPTGGMFAIISGPRPQGIYFSRSHGAPCWIELLTRDTDSAQAFYGAVFGWTAVTSVTEGTAYTMFTLDGSDVAGMMMMPDEVPAAAPAHWDVYFAVADCAAAEKKVVSLGGEVLRPTTDIAIGRFAVVADPHGAKFNLMEFAE